MRSIKRRCFQWPWVTPNPQTTSTFAFFVAFHIFVVSKRRDFIFGIQVEVASPSRRRTNHPWKGRGYVTWNALNFGGPIHISGMAEARAVKLCTKEDCIKSGQRDDKSLLKGAWFCSRDPFLYAQFVTARSYRWDQQDRRWTAAYRTYGSRGHTKA